MKPRKPGAAFAEGETVRYTKRCCLATVLKVHTDDPAGAFYTIRIEGARFAGVVCFICLPLQRVQCDQHLDVYRCALSGSGPASPGAEVQTVETYLEVGYMVFAMLHVCDVVWVDASGDVLIHNAHVLLSFILLLFFFFFFCAVIHRPLVLQTQALRTMCHKASRYHPLNLVI